jgi:beta-xylosidase
LTLAVAVCLVGWGVGPGAPIPEAEELVAIIDPLEGADAPDPFVAVDGEHARLFTTNTPVGNVPAWTWSGDHLVATDALPRLPAWAVPGNTWAPAVTRAGGRWVLAFTAASAAGGRQCIGLATAATVGGPYLAQPEPLLCDATRGGAIDASFVGGADGRLWLLFKDDGNCCGLPTAIRSVPLTADALGLAGEPATLVGADQAWEGGLVEGPTMTEVGGRWLLLYSGNRWDAPDYAVGAAWCDGPAGPCRKQDGPALTSGRGMKGPGGSEFVASTSVVVFHAWSEHQVGYPLGARALRIGRVRVGGDDRVSIRTARRPPGR